MQEKKKIALFDNFDLVWAMQPEAYAAFIQQKIEARIPQTMNESDIQPYEIENGIAIISIENEIMRHGFLNLFTGQKDVETALNSALKDPQVRAILLSIHSPGGIATGTKELGDAIFEAKKTKPVCAWVDGMACSAAYWLAASTGEVYAGPSSTVGSIGVILRHLDKSGWNKEMGLNFTYVTAGSHKAIGNPDNPLSDKDLEVLQNRVNAIYEMFCQDVAQRMGIALDTRSQWADGKDFLALEAYNLGLVTQIMPSRAAVIEKMSKEALMDRAELAAKNPELVAAIKQEGIEEAFKKIEQIKIQTAQSSAKCILAMVDRIAGKEIADKIRFLLEVQITPEQVEALFNAGINFGAKQEDPKSKILNAIENGMQKPLDNPKIEKKDDAQAAIERMARM